ncbi:hypothetical protein DCAR_0831654 [Daucus carota subsp. sativus]|uniref:Uncharacterized protein n=1 Tax=Daucus carota subsp. sativus TaxID=79200 RepID=A0AAF1BAE4_DAUCS|nr:hypothetical protein DCAR_0831654 [Daucus carota subsp. sativus]
MNTIFFLRMNHKNMNVLLGDVSAGKSSLVLPFVKGQFFEFQVNANSFVYSAAFSSQTVAVNDATVKFEIWDTAGQERYHSLAPMYYRGAAAAIIVYDITNQKYIRQLRFYILHISFSMPITSHKFSLADDDDGRFVSAVSEIIMILFNLIWVWMVSNGIYLSLGESEPTHAPVHSILVVYILCLPTFCDKKDIDRSKNSC